MRNLGLMDPAFLGGLGGLSLYDPDAAAYISAVEAADGQALETGVKDAINAFVLGCKADGIWNAIKASCILAGARTLTGALVPLVGAAPTRLGTEGGWGYNRKTGLSANGTNNSLDTNRANNADPDSQCHNAVYVTAVSTNANNCYIGTNDNGPNEIRNTIQASANQFYNRTTSPHTEFGGNGSLATGLIGSSRASASEYRIRNGTFSATVTAAAGAAGSTTVRVFSQSAARYSNARLAFYSIGESLDLALLDARVTALVNALAVAIP
jgi:hypothetical protein